MPAIERPPSLVAERAVRYLREHPEPLPSTEMVRLVLSSSVQDEDTATRILRSAFGDDDRLAYEGGAWRRVSANDPKREIASAGEEADRVLLVLDGHRPARRAPFELRRIAAVRVRGAEVVQGCGGDVSRDGPASPELRDSVREVLADAVPVIHDAPGSLSAFERWLDEPIPEPLSLRKLAVARLGLPARHDLQTLTARLGLSWKGSHDPVSTTETLEECLASLRRPGETMDGLKAEVRTSGVRVPWERFGFDRSFLRSLPETAGTYRFLDRDGSVVYIGRSRNLRRRLMSYFREGGPRDHRVQRLLEVLHRIEIEPLHSELEAVLEEAKQIASQQPTKNVQRSYRAQAGRAERLRSILILEPGGQSSALRAFLIRDGVLVDRVRIGPRGGGLRRIRRVLQDRFFSYRDGPGAERETRVDVELIARWLSSHRDRAVAFDPTHLKNADEVIDRLRWFLEHGGFDDTDGTPIVPR